MDWGARMRDNPRSPESRAATVSRFPVKERSSALGRFPPSLCHDARPRSCLSLACPLCLGTEIKGVFPNTRILPQAPPNTKRIRSFPRTYTFRGKED